jgi:environmental stress-induced protein Ves
MKIIRYSELVVIPWKNGAGVRRDLLSGELSEPQGSITANSTWMLSLADLNQDAPFSSYPGVSRWFMPIGDGRLTLVFKVGEANHPVALNGTSEAHFFSGDDELTMLLHDGPMKALNVMTAGRSPEVLIKRLHCGQSGMTLCAQANEQFSLNLLLVERGGCRVSTSTESHAITAFDSFIYDAAKEIAIETDDGNTCDLITVGLRYVGNL